MCTVDCPFCDQPVAMEPGDDELDCPGCGIRPAVVDDDTLVLSRAA